MVATEPENAQSQQYAGTVMDLDIYPSLPHQNRRATVQPIESLPEVVKRRRGSASIRSAASELGISPTTLCRIEAGHLPDMKTLQTVCRWAGYRLALAEQESE